jgi:hypothetical protein
MRKLLLYLWQKRGDSVSEYAIATDALGRSADFDSRTDASVRVQVARLRAKLVEFYAREGKYFPLQIRIPVGGHEIEWTLEREAAPAVAAPEPAPASPPPVPISQRTRWTLIAPWTVAALLAITCVVLVVRLNHAGKVTAPAPPLPRFWNVFLANGNPADIVVPNMMAFRWPDQHVYLIDGTASIFEKWPESPAARLIAGKWGSPILGQTYVFGRDAFAGYKIDRYLEKHDRSVELVEGASYPSDLASKHNTIFVGLPHSSPYLRNFAEKMNFRIATGIPLTIENKRPGAGEPARYDEKVLSEKRRICPAILALLPAKTDGGRTMILSGRFVNTFSSMLLSADGLKVVDEELRRIGSPDAWEMVIEAEIENSTTIIRTTPLAARAIPAGFWN